MRNLDIFQNGLRILDQLSFSYRDCLGLHFISQVAALFGNLLGLGFDVEASVLLFFLFAGHYHVIANTLLCNNGWNHNGFLDNHMLRTAFAASVTLVQKPVCEGANLPSKQQAQRS